MADNKDFLLGNKARELLRYTKSATKIVSDDVSRRDARAILRKIAQLDDIRDVKTVCGESLHIIDQNDREGFTKANYRLYGEDMRDIAKAIMRGIHGANNVNISTEYMTRLHRINDVLDDCTLLLEYVQICLEDKIIDAKKAGIWTKKITDVKYMAAAWRKKTQELARKQEAEKKAAEKARVTAVIVAAVQKAVDGISGHISKAVQEAMNNKG